MFFLIFSITFVLFLSVFGYFLPTFIALIRNKKNTLAIFLLNLFFGMTFVGWVGALIWALMYEDKNGLTRKLSRLKNSTISSFCICINFENPSFPILHQ